MTLVVVPPPADPTTVVATGAGEHVLDAALAFADRATDPGTLLAVAEVAGAGSIPAAGGSTAAADPHTAPMDHAYRCLLALAAADALTGPSGRLTRLRALGAAIRVLSAEDGD